MSDNRRPRGLSAELLLHKLTIVREFVRELSRTGTLPTALEYGLNGCNSKGTRVPLSAFSFVIGIYKCFLFTAEVVFCESALVFLLFGHCCIPEARSL